MKKDSTTFDADLVCKACSRIGQNMLEMDSEENQGIVICKCGAVVKVIDNIEDEEFEEEEYDLE